MIWPEGMKRTKQREEVYHVLEMSEQPLSAVEIHERLPGHYAISTVYRTLTAFEKAGIVSKSTIMDTDVALYALHAGGHQHYAWDAIKRSPSMAALLKTHRIKVFLKAFRLPGIRSNYMVIATNAAAKVE